MGREVELKLEIASGDAKRLRRHGALAGATPRETDQLSVYFDTKSMKLRRSGLVLRVRQTSDGFVQTIKDEGLFDRGEWEAPVAALRPEAAAAAGTPLADVLGARSFAKLQPVVRSEVRRTRWEVERDGTRIEVALDEGRVRSGDGEQTISELELELIEGHAAIIFELARDLGARVPLRLGVLSKAERGFALVDGTLGRVAKAPPLDLKEDMTAGEGFTAIALSCLRHFRLNEPLIVERREAAALHQGRVAMRRLRSAFSLFAPMIRDDPEFGRLREELRWFTNQLGQARNLDVFLKRPELESAHRAQLEAARGKQYDAIVAVLASKRFRDLMLDLAAWLLTGEWRGRRRAGKPLTGFTGKRIDRLWADIETRGADLALLDEEPRHRLRIDIKKIRYALEFVAGLHRHVGQRQKKFGAALEGLQESLGHLNDMATAREIAASHLSSESEPAAHGGEDEARHIAEAATHFARLEKVGAYWRQAADLPDSGRR
jgi:inorganic triphosphatase YgiF